MDRAMAIAGSGHLSIGDFGTWLAETLPVVQQILGTPEANDFRRLAMSHKTDMNRLHGAAGWLRARADQITEADVVANGNADEPMERQTAPRLDVSMSDNHGLSRLTDHGTYFGKIDSPELQGKPLVLMVSASFNATKPMIAEKIELEIVGSRLIPLKSWRAQEVYDHGMDYEFELPDTVSPGPHPIRLVVYANNREWISNERTWVFPRQ